jgi:hypothetical protein
MTLLTAADLAMFRKIGVGEETLTKAQITRVSDAEAREIYEIEDDSIRDLAGIVFPYFDPRSGRRVNYARILLDTTQEYVAVTRKGT